MEALVDAMVQEVVIRQHYLSDRTIKTVYFGGGTPSLLPTQSIALLMDEIRRHFTIDADAEARQAALPPFRARPLPRSALPPAPSGRGPHGARGGCGMGG